MEEFLCELFDVLCIDYADNNCLKQLVQQLVKFENNPSFKVFDISSHLQMSERHLRRKCQQLFGKNPSQIITLYRIEIAKKQLTNGKSVSEVADGLGYSSPSHFSKVFKNIEGITPSAYLLQKQPTT